MQHIAGTQQVAGGGTVEAARGHDDQEELVAPTTKHRTGRSSLCLARPYPIISYSLCMIWRVHT